MVHLVDRRSYDDRRLNIQLAREINQLKQELAEIIRQRNSLSEELLREKERNLKLIYALRSLTDQALKEMDPTSDKQTVPLALKNRSDSLLLESISELDEDQSSSITYSDSLDPPEVTSVQPIENIGRVDHTPSIWHCLDSMDKSSQLADSPSPIQLIGRKDCDIYHSTPVQTKTVDVANQENLVPQAINRKKKQQVKRATDEPPRYNLRKRTKVCY